MLLAHTLLDWGGTPRRRSSRRRTAGGIKITSSVHPTSNSSADLEDVYQYKIKRFTRLGSGEHLAHIAGLPSVHFNAHAAEHHVN
ncbi:MAG: hypothetical protein U0892_06885 [Pirellulales bacterium]